MALSFQIAIAYFVCKFRPKGLVVRDYIIELRKHKRADTIVSSEICLNIVGFWQALYNQSELERSVLEVKLLDLRRRTGFLEPQNIHEEEEEQEQEVTKKAVIKRARGDDLDTRNRAKRVKNTSKEPGVDAHEKSLEVPGRERYGQELSLCFFQLFALCGHEPSDLPTIAHILVRSCSLLSSLVRSCSYQNFTEIVSTTSENKSGDQPSQSTNTQFATDGEFRAILRSFTSLLHGIRTLANKENGKKYLGGVIYAFTISIQNILKLCGDVARAIAEKEASLPIKSQVSRRKSSKVTKQKKKNDDQPVLRSLSTLLVSILQQFDVSNPTHKELFEGFTFVVIERVAQLLQIITFGHIRCASIDAEISMGGKVNEKSPESELGTRLEERAIQLEVPYIIPLFERCASFAPLQIGHNPAKRTSSTMAPKPAGKFSSRFPFYAGKFTLSRHVRERLQQTLVNCVFGESEETKDEFMDCLRMPQRHVIPPQSKLLREMSKEEWFVAETWRILGWEILSKELE